MKLDYTIESPEERNELVKKMLEENPDTTPAYLEIMADYLVYCMEKQERKEKKILTDNHMQTVNKRETSFEGLVAQLENGEDGIYGLVKEDKQQIFRPKITITKKDVEEIPGMKQLREAIQIWEKKSKTATGRDAYIIKSAIIELRKDQYVLKESYRRPIKFTKISHTTFPVHLDDSFTLDEENYVIPSGVSICDPKICSYLLCNYSRLKQEGYGHFDGDLYYLMEVFDECADRALKDYPLYEEIVTCKIDGLQNAEIQKILQEKFDTTHSLEYISSLWRKKIPKLIADAAEDDLLDWYFMNQEKGKYKKCSRCGQIKLAHNKYFSKNKTSKDGFYSICKACRNAKTKMRAAGKKK